MQTEDLIDETALIDESEKYEPLGRGKESCASKPRACANCTCGRRELEVALGPEEAKKALEEGGTRSSCGSCYLGDAFRCATCPYRGLPAFKGGDKVKLDMKTENGSTATGGTMATPATTSERVKLVSETGKVSLKDIDL